MFQDNISVLYHDLSSRAETLPYNICFITYEILCEISGQITREKDSKFPAQVAL